MDMKQFYTADQNGRIATRNASDFDLPKGATLEIIEGTID